MTAPRTEQEASEIVRSGGQFSIIGHSSRWQSSANEQLSSRNLTGIIEWSPDDLVIKVGSGTLLDELNAELANRKQCIPSSGGTVGGLVATNPPMPWDTWPYTARYWVLGLRAVRGDGTVIKCGSKAVKNVAGYDVQKLFVGSWGALGFITEVTFRLFPLRPMANCIELQPPKLVNTSRNADLMICIKNVFDPERKFNPGIMGLF